MDRRKIQFVKILILLAVMLVIPLIYAAVKGYFATFLAEFIMFFGATSKIGIMATIIGFDLIGSIVVALIALLPVGYLFPKRWALASVILTVITLAVLIFPYPNSDRNWSLDNIQGCEYLGVFISYLIMAFVGSRVSYHRSKIVV